MAIPKTLKEITREKAVQIVRKHPEGYWDGTPFASDFIYSGRMTKWGRRSEMVRFNNFGFKCSYEHGVCAN